MVHHLGREIADLLVLEVEIAHEEGAGGDVHDGAGEGFVQRAKSVAETGNTFAIAQSFREGGAEGEECVFCCVVVIN